LTVPPGAHEIEIGNTPILWRLERDPLSPTGQKIIVYGEKIGTSEADNRKYSIVGPIDQELLTTAVNKIMETQKPGTRYEYFLFP